jgi:hypothetical protein
MFDFAKKCLSGCEYFIMAYFGFFEKQVIFNIGNFRREF